MYNYTLSFQDVLTYNQFNLSSTKGKKTGNRFRIIVSVYFVLLAGILFYIGNYISGALLVAAAAIYPFLGQLLTKRLVMKTLKNAVVTNCSGMIDSPISLQLLDNHMVIIDQGGDCNYKISSVESVSEITDLFFFKINNSQIIIVPKSDEGLTSSIRKVIADHQLNHIINLDWKY